MKKYSSQRAGWTMGFDLGDRSSYYKILDEDAEVVEEGRMKMTREVLEKRFRSYEPMRVVIEAGTHSSWVSRLLKECGHEVWVANPRKLRLIYENRSKDDRVDAEYLARVGRLDPKLLAPVVHRSQAAQVDLALIRSRETLVQARTKLINHVRSSVKTVGARLPKCSTPTFSQRVGAHLPECLQPALEPILEMIGALTAQIRQYDQRIQQWGEQRYPETKILRQVHGVGPLTALAYVLTLENPDRFGKSRAVGAFLGLSPRKDCSGDKNPQLRITKTGDVYLRRLLVGSAQYILGPFGPDNDLRRKGLQLCERGGKNAKKRALVAVARKLSVLLHHLWTTGEVYEPLYQSHRSQSCCAG